jgi:hypothetical protein
MEKDERFKVHGVGDLSFVIATSDVQALLDKQSVH